MSHFGRLWRAAKRVSRTHYPRFIFGLPLARGQIPIFTYHDVEHAAFARDLEFLHANGYRTLSIDEYLRARTGGKRITQRAVLLTFDDARKSFFTIALPLLRAFDARAVLFAPSYWMARRASVPGSELFMSWQELRECLASGHVDVESHAHRHALVAVSARLVDFAHPHALARYDVYDWPMRSAGGLDELGRPALGTPIYDAAPLLSASHRYLDSDRLTHACRELVARGGGAHFFSRPDWRAALSAVCRKHRERCRSRKMDAAKFDRLVASEFELSRAEFEIHLGHTPRTIAYPWMLGSRRSLHLARRHGFRAAFGVALDFATERSRDTPLPAFGRYKCDWLRFMPGEQRSNVFGALRRKLADFASTQHLAH